MKKLSIIGLSAFLMLFMGCTDSKKETTTATTSNAEKNSVNSKEIYRAIETGDVSKIDFLTDDAIDHDGGPSGDIKGADNIKAMLADLHTHFSNLKMEQIADATSADGEYHFALVRMTGTTKDDKMGMPANMTIDQTTVDVVKIRDGKAAEHWGFFTRKDMQGMMPPGGGGDKMSNDKMSGNPDSTKK